MNMINRHLPLYDRNPKLDHRQVLGNNYYAIETNRHVYYDAENIGFIRSYAENTNYDFDKLGKN